MKVIELRRLEYHVILDEQEYNAFRREVDYPADWCPSGIASLINFILIKHYDFAVWRYSK